MRDFEDTVAEFRNRIYSLSYYFLGHKEEAEDATQEALIRLWENWNKVRGTNALAWLLRVTRNVCMDVLRKRRSGHAVVSGNDFDAALATIPGNAPDPREALETSDLQEQVRKALTRIDEPYRSIVILREIQQMSYAEITEALGIPLPTVKVYLHRGRRMLREQLRERGADAYER